MALQSAAAKELFADFCKEHDSYIHSEQGSGARRSADNADNDWGTLPQVPKAALPIIETKSSGKFVDSMVKLITAIRSSGQNGRRVFSDLLELAGFSLPVFSADEARELSAAAQRQGALATYIDNNGTLPYVKGLQATMLLFVRRLFGWHEPPFEFPKDVAKYVDIAGVGTSEYEQENAKYALSLWLSVMRNIAAMCTRFTAGDIPYVQGISNSGLFLLHWHQAVVSSAPASTYLNNTLEEHCARLQAEGPELYAVIHAAIELARTMSAAYDTGIVWGHPQEDNHGVVICPSPSNIMEVARFKHNGRVEPAGVRSTFAGTSFAALYEAKSAAGTAYNLNIPEMRFCCAYLDVFDMLPRIMRRLSPSDKPQPRLRFIEEQDFTARTTHRKLFHGIYNLKNPEACPAYLPKFALFLPLNKASGAGIPALCVCHRFGMPGLLIPTTERVAGILRKLYGMPQRDSLLQESGEVADMLHVSSDAFSTAINEWVVGGGANRAPLCWVGYENILDVVNGSEERNVDNAHADNVFHSLLLRDAFIPWNRNKEE